MKNYYVYVYYDTRKDPIEPIYVGKGRKNRYKSHLVNGASNSYLAAKLNKIKEAGLTPFIDFAATDLSAEEASLLEIELIAKFGRANKNEGTLCNFTDGGDGTFGYKHSEDTIKLFSEQRKGKKQTEAQYKANCERKTSEETKKKLSELFKGHNFHTISSRQKISQANLGRKLSEETKKLFSEQRKGKKQTEAQYRANCDPNRNRFSKKIKCNNNNTIYKSINEAAKDLKLHPSAIGAVARGIRNHHKGFTFSFIEDLPISES
jgi:hypothetical protein